MAERKQKKPRTTAQKSKDSHQIGLTTSRRLLRAAAPEGRYFDDAVEAARDIVENKLEAAGHVANDLLKLKRQTITVDFIKTLFKQVKICSPSIMAKSYASLPKRGKRYEKQSKTGGTYLASKGGEQYLALPKIVRLFKGQNKMVMTEGAKNFLVQIALNMFKALANESIALCAISKKTKGVHASHIEKAAELLRLN